MMEDIIDGIRSQVVKYLLKQHDLAEKNRAEFYFEVDYIGFDALHYTLQSRVNNDLHLKILCYGRWSRSPIVYLIVTARQELFLIGDFDSSHYHELSDIGYRLDAFFQQSMREKNFVKFIEGQNLSGSILWIFQLIKSKNIIENLDWFFYNVKPIIDKIISPIKTNKFSYLFFNKRQFEEYLKNEPFYSFPTISVRKNIYLSSLRVLDFRGIKQATIDNLPKATRWIVLTGENGYGKTSVLQAIAAGLYGSYDESGRELVPETAFIGVEYYANDELVETNSRVIHSEAANNKLTNELATYGASRLQVSASVTRDAIEEQFPTTYHLFNSDGVLLNVEQLLKDTKIYDLEFHEQLVDLFKTLIPKLADINVDLLDKLPEVRYVEQDDTRKPLTTGLPLNQLAAGYRNILAMIGDLVYRLSAKQNVKNLYDLQGIVLIDEIELHLHPVYQKSLVEILTVRFPNLQFIVSTHSPIPLLGIPKDVGVVLLHVTRTAETGINIEQLDIDFSVLTPNAILSSPILGFKELIPESKSDDIMVRPENTYEAVQLDQQIRTSINEYLSPDRQEKLLKLIKEK